VLLTHDCVWILTVAICVTTWLLIKLKTVTLFVFHYWYILCPFHCWMLFRVHHSCWE
jgi:hypothetical protein